MAELRPADLDLATPWPSLDEALEHAKVLTRRGWTVIEERAPRPTRGDGAVIVARVHHPDSGNGVGEITHWPAAHDPGE